MSASNVERLNAFQTLQNDADCAAARESAVVVVRLAHLHWALETLEDDVGAAEELETREEIESDVADLLREIARAPVFNLSPHGRVLVDRLMTKLKLV